MFVFLLVFAFMFLCFFFFNDTATTEIYTLSLHDALPIFRRARRLHHGQVFRHHLSGSASRGEATRGTGCEPMGARRLRVARSNMRAARPAASAVRDRPGSRHPAAGGCRHRISRREEWLAAARTHQCRPGQLHAGGVPAVLLRLLWARVAAGPPSLPWAPAACHTLGVWLPIRERAHAGYGRRVRPADPRDRRAFVQERSAAPLAIRSGTTA